MLKTLTSRERVSRARRRMLDRAPFYGVLASNLAVVEQADGETMATDAKSLFFSPDFVDGITDNELMGTVVHEVRHCTNCHFSRRQWREHELWNVACDLEINPGILNDGWTLFQGALFQERFVGMIAEEIYAILDRERSEGKPTPQPQPGGVLDAPQDTDASELEAEWKERTTQAIQIARKAGKLAGVPLDSSIQEIADRLASPVRNWKAELRNFIDELGTRDASWDKPNRRFIGLGIYLPSEKPIRPSVVGWLIDVSGSMDKRANLAALSEAQSALDDGAIDQLVVVYVDDKIHHVDTYEPGDTITLRGAAGGGTDFRSVMAWARDQEFAAIVFVTDGETRHGVDPECPVLWAITGPQSAADAVPGAAGYGTSLSLYGR